jgi:hypothetical protein
MVRRLTRLKIHEVSSVDRGAGEGVHVVMFKRDFSPKERDAAASSGAAMEDGSFPIKTAADLKNAIQAYGRAKNQAAAKAHIISRARALGLTGSLPDGWINKKLEELFADIPLSISDDGIISHKAVVAKGLSDSALSEAQNRVRDAVAIFCKSCREIVASEQADEGARDALLEKSYGEFVGYLGGLTPEGKEAATVAAVSSELTDLAKQRTDEDEMDPKEIEALKAKAAEAETLKADLAKRDAEIAKRDAELAFAKMSDAHKAHAAKLSEAERAKFVALSAEERDKAMETSAKKRDEDPVFKAMNERLAKAESDAAELRKRLDAEEDAKEKIAFAKRAVDNYGQPEAFGETLRKAFKGDAAAQAEVDKVVTSLKRVAETSATFKNFGQGGGAADSAKAEMAQKVEALRKVETKLSPEQAYARIFAEDKALAKRVREEERAGA